MSATDASVEEFLAHHGIIGMKWGRHQANRALNKATRAKEKKQDAADFIKLRKSLRPTSKSRKEDDTSTKSGRRARVVDIERARQRINSGAAKADKKEAKAQFKKDKVTMGSRAARNILKSKKNALYQDVRRSQEAKDGYELVSRMIQSASTNMQYARINARLAAERKQREGSRNSAYTM